MQLVIKIRFYQKKITVHFLFNKYNAYICKHV